MILTPEQIAAVTARRRSDAQRRALDEMRVPYRVRHDGSLVVLLAHLEAVPGTVAPVRQREPELQP